MKRFVLLMGLLAYSSLECEIWASQNVTFSCTGKIDTVVDASNFLGNQFQIGDPLFGKITYDLSVMDANVAEEFGEYPQLLPPSEISFSINGFTFRASPPINLTIRNNEVSPVDNFIYLGNTVSLPPQFDFGAGRAVDFQLADNTGTAVGTDALPSNLNLETGPIPRSSRSSTRVRIGNSIIESLVQSKL